MTRDIRNFLYPAGLLKPGRARSFYYLCILAAVVARLAIAIVLIDFKDPLLWEYGIIARNIATTGVFALNNPTVPSAFMPPAYPLIIAGIYKLFGIGLGAHIGLMVLLGVFTVAVPLLIGWIARQIWGSTTGLIALLIAFFWPPLLSMSGRLHCLPIYTALQLAAIGAAFVKGWPSWRRGIAVGGLCGLYGNFRFEAPVIMAILCYAIARTESRFGGTWGRVWGRALLTTALAFSVFALCLTPWVVRNGVVFGKPVMSTSGGFNLLRGHHAGATGAGRDVWPAAREDQNASTTIPKPVDIRLLKYDRVEDELIADDLYREAALDFIRSNPRGEIRLFGKKVFYFLVSDFTHSFYRLWPLWVPSLLALVLGFRHWLRTGVRDARQQALWMLFLIQLAIAVVFFVLPRYRIAVDFVPVVFVSAWLSRTSMGRVISRQTLFRQHEITSGELDTLERTS